MVEGRGRRLWLLSVFLVGLSTISYRVIYIGVWKNFHARQPCATLWERVGCRSKYPILRCMPHQRSPEERHHDTVVTTFDSLLYLDACRHDTCSLVGSSGNLRNYLHGKLIDKSNVVIRVNNPPIRGYEDYVGTRPADILIFNDHIANCFGNSTHPTLYIRSTDNALTKNGGVIKKCQAHWVAPLYSFSRFIQQQTRAALLYYAERFPSTRPSIHATSGLKAVLFSMMICRQVVLFGFGMQGAKTWHYYPPYSNYTPSQHDISIETRIIQDLANGTFRSSLADFRDDTFGKLNITLLGY